MLRRPGLRHLFSVVPATSKKRPISLFAPAQSYRLEQACTTSAEPATSARVANTHKCSATSTKPRYRFASLGTPCGAVALRHEHILGNQPTQYAALAAGDRSTRSLSAYFPGASTAPPLAPSLTRLIRLQQAPPVSLLQSRIQSAAAALPSQPLTSAVVVAMIDLLRDRLQKLLPRKSSWPSIRPLITCHLGYLNLPLSDDSTSTVQWKLLHPGHCVIDTLIVDNAIGSSTTAEGRHSNRWHHSTKAAMENSFQICLTKVPDHQSSPPTIGLYLKPKDAHGARGISTVRWAPALAQTQMLPVGVRFFVAIS